MITISLKYQSVFNLLCSYFMVIKNNNNNKKNIQSIYETS